MTKKARSDVAHFLNRYITTRSEETANTPRYREQGAMVDVTVAAAQCTAEFLSCVPDKPLLGHATAFCCEVPKRGQEARGLDAQTSVRLDRERDELVGRALAELLERLLLSVFRCCRC